VSYQKGLDWLNISVSLDRDCSQMLSAIQSNARPLLQPRKHERSDENFPIYQRVQGAVFLECATWTILVNCYFVFRTRTYCIYDRATDVRQAFPDEVPPSHLLMRLLDAKHLRSMRHGKRSGPADRAEQCSSRPSPSRGAEPWYRAQRGSRRNDNSNLNSFISKTSHLHEVSRSYSE
jgi:hypothetical protein